MSAHRKVRTVVIVDDSKGVRAWLRLILEQDSKLRVVGEARDACEARHIIKQTSPDVITLDIEMPGMGGLAFLEKLMSLRPMPVVMIAGSTRTTYEVTIRALLLGAVDCILKPTIFADTTRFRDIARRVYSAACSNVQPLYPTPIRSVRPCASGDTGPMPLILIGASTGGVAALETVLPNLDPAGPPVVIVQHMPGPFLVSFSQHLDRKLSQDVQLARDGEVLTRGAIRLAPCLDHHTGVLRQAAKWHTRFGEKTDKELYCPSVDYLFKTAFPHAADIIAVILTGLGRDGAGAMLELHQAGATTLGQDAQSSVVYGMPRAAQELGALDHQYDLNDIGAAIIATVAKYASSRTTRSARHA